MAWQHRLPDGVRHEGSSSQGFILSVSLPVDEDGLAPLQCPEDAGHRFKVTLTQSPSGQSSDCYCPYCGTRAATDQFLAAQLPRLDACCDSQRRRVGPRSWSAAAGHCARATSRADAARASARSACPPAPGVQLRTRGQRRSARSTASWS